MSTRHYVLILLVFLLLILAGCEKKECKQDAQCNKQYYTGKCVENKCQFEKIPKYWCEDTVCTGKQGNLLEKYCSNNVCLSGIPPEKTKLTSLVNEHALAGDKFKLTTSFNQPFNVRKDLFETTITLNQQSPINTDHKITRVELSGTTKDRRTITLADKEINKPLWGAGSDASAKLVIDFPTTDIDGEYTGLSLKVYYSYVQTTGTQKQTKTNVLQNNYANLKFAWARPEKPYPCPAQCEQKEGMSGVCNTATGFCEYTPMPNTCGNFLCEESATPPENKCTCPKDCGPCTGTVGVYSIKTCTPENKCVTTLKQGIAVTPQTIFDDRPLGSFHLQNNYQYNNPFNVKSDAFTVYLTLYQAKEQTSNVKIETIRLLDGTQQIADLPVNKDLPAIGSTITEQLRIPPQANPETGRNLVIAVWYQHTTGGVMQKGSFQKSLGKITLLSPE
ncbi:hypothetical protein HY484_02825 [Candidatus Woesearchaeota archaeon]|nr:hypothetical protein [Candidatus Woesearchaeota archaeon]